MTTSWSVMNLERDMENLICRSGQCMKKFNGYLPKALYYNNDLRRHGYKPFRNTALRMWNKKHHIYVNEM